MKITKAAIITYTEFEKAMAQVANIARARLIEAASELEKFEAILRGTEKTTRETARGGAGNRLPLPTVQGQQKKLERTEKDWPALAGMARGMQGKLRGNKHLVRVLMQIKTIRRKST